MESDTVKRDLWRQFNAVLDVLYGGTGADMARDTGIPQSRISRISRGEPESLRPYKKTMTELREAIGDEKVDRAIREAESSSFFAHEAEGEYSADELPSQLSNELLDTRSVTFYSMQPGAGTHGERPVHERGTKVVLQTFLLRRILGGTIPNDLRCMILDGESMQPEVRDGSLVFFTPVKDVPDAGRYVIARDGELLLKHVQRRAGGVYRIKSAHPNYDPEDLQRQGDTFQSLETGASVSFRVVGKFLQSLHPSDFQKDLAAERIAQAFHRAGLINSHS